MKPDVRLLDARALGMGESDLRAWTRGFPAAFAAAHVSRSYRYPYALVAWYERPVGVDIEHIDHGDPAFAASICTPAERKLLGGHDDELVTSLWCGKEALSKVLGDARSYDPRWLEAPLLWPEGRSGSLRAERIGAPDGYVAWLCWRSLG